MTTKVIISAVEGNSPILAKIELLHVARLEVVDGQNYLGSDEWIEERTVEIPVNGCFSFNVWPGRRVLLSEEPNG